MGCAKKRINLKVVQSFIHLSEPGYDSDDDVIVHVAVVPAGTICHVTNQTGGVAIGENTGNVPRLGYITADAWMTIKML
jgi:hypothetical protein